MIIIFILLLGLSPINVFAIDNKVENTTTEYWEDDIYVETAIEILDISTYSTNTVTKTNKYKNSKSAIKSKNKAIGEATMKQYIRGKVVQTKYPSVTLTCSANGKLS